MSFRTIQCFFFPTKSLNPWYLYVFYFLMIIKRSSPNNLYGLNQYWTSSVPHCISTSPHWTSWLEPPPELVIGILSSNKYSHPFKDLPLTCVVPCTTFIKKVINFTWHKLSMLLCWIKYQGCNNKYSILLKQFLLLLKNKAYLHSCPDPREKI